MEQSGKVCEGGYLEKYVTSNKEQLVKDLNLNILEKLYKLSKTTSGNLTVLLYWQVLPEKWRRDIQTNM